MTATPSAPGWHDDPDGRRRWWDGHRWGAYAPWDDHGSLPRPSLPPQRPRLDGALTFDPTAAGRVARAQGAEGRQPDDAGPPSPRPGAARRWESLAPAVRTGGPPAKRMATAYLLLALLGLLGGHRHYLGRTPSATAQMMLSFAAAAAVVVVSGGAAPLWLLALPAAAGLWWTADLFRTPGMVRERNARPAAGGADHRADAPGYERGWPDP